MKIKEIHLQNFRGFEDVTIQFPESNVCVLIGANGSGKSSVLEALDNILGHINQFAIGQDNEKKRIINDLVDTTISVNYEDVKIGKPNAIYSAQIIENENLLTFELLQTSHSLKSKGNFYLLANLIEQSQAIYPILIKYSVERFILGKQQTINSEKERQNASSLIYQFLRHTINFDAFVGWFKDLEDKENAEKITQKDFNLNNPQLNFIRQTINIFLTEFDEKTFNNLKVFREEISIEREVNGKSELTLTIEKNGIPFKLQQLSEGEKLILMTVCDIARKLILLNPALENPLKGEGIILIDEIELHLHPQWQRNVIPALRKTFPNIQFIITTHSPQVLSNIDKSEVRILKDWQVYEPSGETLGSDTNYILESIMETDKSPAEDELREVFKLINDKKFVEAEMVANKLVADKKISVNNLVFQRIDSFKERMAILNK